LGEADLHQQGRPASNGRRPGNPAGRTQQALQKPLHEMRKGATEAPFFYLLIFQANFIKKNNLFSLVVWFTPTKLNPVVQHGNVPTPSDLNA
jgi:hypothetical protein